MDSFTNHELEWDDNSRSKCLAEAPSYCITRDADLSLRFIPPYGTRELANALSYHFPALSTVEDKMREAILIYLRDEEILHAVDGQQQPVGHGPASSISKQLQPRQMSHESADGVTQVGKIIEPMVWNIKTGITKPMKRKKTSSRETKSLQSKKYGGDSCEPHRRREKRCDPQLCSQNKQYKHTIASEAEPSLSGGISQDNAEIDFCVEGGRRSPKTYRSISTQNNQQGDSSQAMVPTYCDIQADHDHTMSGFECSSPYQDNPNALLSWLTPRWVPDSFYDIGSPVDYWQEPDDSSWLADPSLCHYTYDSDYNHYTFSSDLSRDPFDTEELKKRKDKSPKLLAHSSRRDDDSGGGSGGGSSGSGSDGGNGNEGQNKPSGSGGGDKNGKKSKSSGSGGGDGDYWSGSSDKRSQGGCGGSCSTSHSGHSIFDAAFVKAYRKCAELSSQAAQDLPCYEEAMCTPGNPVACKPSRPFDTHRCDYNKQYGLNLPVVASAGQILENLLFCINFVSSTIFAFGNASLFDGHNAIHQMAEVY